jgi:hypothetical protein
MQYEALRRVHLLPDGENDETLETVNANVFRNLESPVSEGGENFSTGYVTRKNNLRFGAHLLAERNNSFAWHGRSSSEPRSLLWMKQQRGKVSW